jgi:nucleoside-diphosphate-sugar epimerase
LDTRQATELLDWEPKIPIREGILETAKWIEQNIE